MKKLFKKKKKGFTLVELLVVIAVLGIMAGIGLNSMSGITDIFRKRADDRTLEQVARTMQIRLMADDHKLLPASPSSELVYTTDIVPEMNFISQTTGELMIAKATGYKIFGNQNIAQDELNTNDLELYVTFYSDSADGKTHYMRKATISATYINWEDGDGSGSGSNKTYISFKGSENLDGYRAHYGTDDGDPNDPMSHMENFTEHYDKISEHSEDLGYSFNFTFDPESPSWKNSYASEFTDPYDLMTSNLQVKNFFEALVEKTGDGNIESLGIDVEHTSYGRIRGDNLKVDQFAGLDLDSENTMISPLTGAEYKISYYDGSGSAGNFHGSFEDEDAFETRSIRFNTEGNGIRLQHIFYMVKDNGSGIQIDDIKEGDVFYQVWVNKAD